MNDQTELTRPTMSTKLKPERDGRGCCSIALLSGLPEHVCPQCGGRGKVYEQAQIGARLKHERELSGITGSEIARRMGYSPMYLCDLEHGRRDWKVNLIEAYLDALSQASA